MPFAQMNTDPEVMRYFPRTFTTRESNSFIDQNIELIANHGWGAWAVDVVELETFIGFVGFSHPASWHPCAGNVDIGWRLNKNHWGLGYATEAARQVLSTGFGSIGFASLVSFTSACNFPSIQVMKKIGMHQDHRGFEHPHISTDSRLRKHVVFRINQNDWQGT